MDIFNWSFAVSLFGVAIIKLFSLFLVYCFRPTWLLTLWKEFRIKRAGVSKHYIKISDTLEISYLERSGQKDGQVLLFVHGFSGDKEVYCDLVRLLPRNFRIIMIDLPGHGESKSADEKGAYSIDAQVENVHKFVEAYGFGKRKINLIGFSMGGHIAGVYAARHGEMLSSVVLACPAGIKGSKETEFIQKSRKDLENKVKLVDSCALLPNTASELQEMLKLVLYHDIQLPHHIASAFLMLKKHKYVVYKKVFSDLAVPDQHYLLDSVLENIHVPLLCVWGEHDKVLHVSGSEVIQQRVKKAEVHVVDRCGHAITIDRPRKLLKILSGFLAKINA